MTASIDPGALLRIDDLTLRAKTVVEGFFGGLHRSPFHGQSIEFAEFRPYSAGDDLRSLDWKRLARSDREYVRKYEDETTRRCYLVFDQSRSMDFGSVGYTKLEYARTLTATLAYFLIRCHDDPGLLTFAEAVEDFIRPARRVGHLRHLIAALAKPVTGAETNPEPPLTHLAAIAARRGLVVVVSDFLTPVERLRRPLSLIRGRGHEALLIRVLDPGERELDGAATYRTDLETGERFFIDPAEANEGYRKRFVEHQNELVELTRSVGVDLFTLTTTDPLSDALFELIQTRNRIAARSRGRRGNPNTGAA